MGQRSGPWATRGGFAIYTSWLLYIPWCQGRSVEFLPTVVGHIMPYRPCPLSVFERLDCLVRARPGLTRDFSLQGVDGGLVVQGLVPAELAAKELSI